MSGITTISITLSLIVILAYLTFSQNEAQKVSYRDNYTFVDSSFNNSITWHFLNEVNLGAQFPLKIRAVDTLHT